MLIFIRAQKANSIPHCLIFDGKHIDTEFHKRYYKCKRKSISNTHTIPHLKQGILFREEDKPVPEDCLKPEIALYQHLFLLFRSIIPCIKMFDSAIVGGQDSHPGQMHFIKHHLIFT